MALQFDPNPYLQAFRIGRENEQANQQRPLQLLQALGNVGEGINKYQQAGLAARQQNVATGLKAVELNLNPDDLINYERTGKFPQPQEQTSIANSAAPTPQFADAGVADYNQPMQPQGNPSVSSPTPEQVIAAHTQHLARQKPSFGSMFTRKPFDVNAEIKRMQSGDYSNLPNYNDKQMKTLEMTPAYTEMKRKQEGSVTVDEAGALLNLDDKHIQKLKNIYKDGTIPQDKWTLLSSGVKMEGTLGTKESQQQDKLETQARQSVTNLRGDKSLARAEEQRDAAIVAYNRIQEIEKQGGQLNPIDYTDILGQIYKARTGAAPTEQVLSEIRQATAKEDFGKAYTYVTGQQSPATTLDITRSLKLMAQSMGQQADKFHEGYMRSHLIKLKGLEDSRWLPILQTGRGQSFQEATGNGGEMTGDIKQINSQQEYNALPSGSEYIDSTGKRARKR